MNIKKIADERFDPLINENDYAGTNFHINRYLFAAKYINSVRMFKKNNNILDVACGYGYGSKILHSSTGKRVYGVDIDKDAVNYAKKVYFQNNNVDFLVGNILHLPFPKSFFQYVVCFETIEHLNYQDALRAIREIYRVLKPQGTVIISSPNKIFSMIDSAIFGIKNSFHLHEFNPRELKELLVTSGFEIKGKLGQALMFHPIYFLARFKLFPKSYFYPTRNLIPELAVDYMYVAKKLSRK